MTEFNISSTAPDWRGQALSNFVLSPFVLDGQLLASVEGFIQGIKFAPHDARRVAIFETFGMQAKQAGAQAERRVVWWQDQELAYGSAAHHALIGRAIRARILQSEGLTTALASTRGHALVHLTPEPESPATSLPATVFCAILTQLREEILAGRSA